ncbi:heme exporter protein CcmD [Actinobacillus succinogenes]|uniref:Heme exporter protein D n=1 Tax=Actinobacillus succinogenes (strain ATCC 55618 / DSM 22257 / CCUG 43843 / 130Z) TaxID=339671 RepID=A6VML9_ACTSZ|nr:heme exporter protein CcmD [Actinobacillus succinogenes]ABR74216.1 Heme exporter protein D (CcmD) [Actinobacillus succinogenes 130Z]PHI39354.1 heme exporter protein CcmD [Actinobacillus succinogenes]
MFFQSWSDFFNMGGYGFYVWLSYGISLAAIIGLIVYSYKGKHSILAEVKREQVREQRLQANKSRGGL